MRWKIRQMVCNSVQRLKLTAALVQRLFLAFPWNLVLCYRRVLLTLVSHHVVHLVDHYLSLVVYHLRRCLPSFFYVPSVCACMIHYSSDNQYTYKHKCGYTLRTHNTPIDIFFVGITCLLVWLCMTRRYYCNSIPVH